MRARIVSQSFAAALVLAGGAAAQGIFESHGDVGVTPKSGAFEFDAVALGAAFLDQALEQGAIAATQIEYAFTRLHPTGDQIEIGAFEGPAHSFTRFR